ncbi:MAG: hypothetical protein FWC97_07195 [Treponema sp.]|nr:hypothetical protein [Treponema sp.]
MKNRFVLVLFVALFATIGLMFAACEGPMGLPGTPGNDGQQGPPGPPGSGIGETGTTWSATANNPMFPTAINLVFAEPISGLTADHILVQSGTGQANMGALSGGGTEWSLAVTVERPGVVWVQIDMEGVERGPRRVEILPYTTWTARPNSFRNTTRLNFEFSAAVSGLEESHFTLILGSDPVVPVSISGEGRSWSLEIPPTVGNISVSINKERIYDGTQDIAAFISDDEIVVTAAVQHSFVIRADGSLWAFGGNGNGRLGDGTLTERQTPIQIQPGTLWMSVTAGQTHSAGIRDDRSLWTWGNNFSGHLGDGTAIQQTTPIQIRSDITWLSVSAAKNGNHTLAISTDGSLWAWGSNSNGQLGDGTMTNHHVPIQIPGTWKYISAGTNSSFAINSDGELWAWGHQQNGRLGDGVDTNTNRLTPVQILPGTTWRSVAAGNTHTVAIDTDGELWAWGAGGAGQMGNGSTTANNPLPVPVGTPAQQADPDWLWESVSAGNDFAVAIREDGTLWAWGAGGSGRLGNGATGNQNAPVEILSDILSASTGHEHALSVSNDGTIQAWGAGANGRLGNGATGNQNSPILVNFP